MNIVFYNLNKSEQVVVKTAKLKARFIHTTLSVDKLPPKNTEILCIHTSEKITTEIVKQLPQLKLIVTRTAGVDHVDLPACEKRNISVISCPGLNAESVAEFAVGMIISMARSLPSVILSNNKKQFSKSIFSTELAGKTLGVVGTGAIGMRVIKFMRAFDMKVVAFDIKPNQAMAKEFGFQYVSFDKVIKQSDVISLHMPATKETYHAINAKTFQAMKEGVMIVNTARGSVIDAQALLAALKSEKVSRIALDVLEDEQFVFGSVTKNLTVRQKELFKFNQALLKHPQVYITPHIAHQTEESEGRIIKHAVQAIKDFQAKN